MSLHLSSIRGLTFDEFMRQPINDKPKIRTTLPFSMKATRKRKLDVGNEPKKPQRRPQSELNGGLARLQTEDGSNVGMEAKTPSRRESTDSSPVHHDEEESSILHPEDSVMSLSSTTVFINPQTSQHLSPLDAAKDHSISGSRNRHGTSIGITPLDLSGVKKSSPPQRKHQPASTMEFSSPAVGARPAPTQRYDEVLVTKKPSTERLSAITRGWKVRYRFNSRKGKNLRTQILDTLRFMESIEREGDPSNVALYEQLRKQLSTIQTQFIRFMTALNVPFIEQQMTPRVHHDAAGAAGRVGGHSGTPSTIVIFETTSPHLGDDRAMTPPLKRLSTMKIARSSRKVNGDVKEDAQARRSRGSKSVPRSVPSIRSRSNSRTERSRKSSPERAKHDHPRSTTTANTNSRSHTQRAHHRSSSPPRRSPHRSEQPTRTAHSSQNSHRNPAPQGPPTRQAPAAPNHQPLESPLTYQYQSSIDIDRVFARDTKLFTHFRQHAFQTDARSNIPQLSLRALFHKYADKSQDIDDRLIGVLQAYTDDYLGASEYVKTKMMQHRAPR